MLVFTPKTFAALDAAGPHMVSPMDWIRLAMAALDQAGLPAAEQDRIASILIEAIPEPEDEPVPSRRSA